MDAGLSGRQIRLRLAEIGRSPELLTGILITHEHTDHTQGLATIAAKLGVPVYCNRLTKEAIETQVRLPLNFRLFETGASFAIGDFGVESFSVPHDAYDPVNFLVQTNEGSVAYLTDLGHATKLVVERAKHARFVMVEANHDIKLLQDDTKRPWSVKQRILSRHGHLSNEAAATLLGEIVNEKTKHIFLGHLSRDCNSPELAMRAVTQKLQSIGSQHWALTVAAQDLRSDTFQMDS